MYHQYKPRHAVKIKSYQMPKKSRRPPLLPKRFYWFGAILLLIIGSLAYWLFFSGSFRLKQVEVQAAKNFSSQDLESMAWSVARQAKLLPADNLWLYDKPALLKNIEEKYYLNDVKIKTRLPHKLLITFAEKDYNLIWQEEGRFYYINEQGDIIVEKLMPEPNICLVENRSRSKKEGRRINISRNYLTFASQLNNAFNERVKGLPDKTIFIDDELNTIKIQITNGPILKFNTEESADRQLVKLETLRKYELKDGRIFNAKQYIDLRYGDRVFYQ